MNENRREDRDHLRCNVEKLLSRAEPELAMPRESKERVLRALLEEQAERPSILRFSLGRGNVVTRGRLSWLTAATAAIILVAFFLWPGGMQDGVAWADVVRHLNEVESLIARVSLADTPPSGEPKTGFAMLYQKDPGMFRTEVFEVPESAMPTPDGRTLSADAQWIVITRGGLREATIVRLTPREKLAQRTTLSFAGEMLDARAAMPRDLVAEAWSRLKQLTSDRTRAIGEREIDGVLATGFEADIRDVFGDPAAPYPDGVLRVWAASDTGAPVEVEAEFRDPRGWHHHTRFWNLEWNAPLDSELFEIPDLEGWTVLEEEDHQVGFTRTRLRDGVTLRVGPPDGPAIFTERDVEAVISGRMFKPAGEAPPRTTIFLTTTPAGEERLRAYTSEHLGESLQLDFDGETRFEIRIGGVIEKKVLMDITGLSTTLEEFEAEYLTD